MQRTSTAPGLDTKADLDAGEKKTSVAKRAEAYRNLDSSALLAKADQGDDAAMKRLSDLYYEKKDNRQSPIAPIRGNKAGIDEAFRSQSFNLRQPPIA